MMNKYYHYYHLVTYSPWPLLTALNMLLNLLIMIKLMNYKSVSLLNWLMFMTLILCLIQWNYSIIYESLYQGYHTKKVQLNLSYGMILFILSEVMFFFSFFWMYFHLFLSPSMEIGNIWPPKNIIPFNPFDIPLLNTVILLTSGITITMSHFFMLNNNYFLALNYNLTTILLAIYFTQLQHEEYNASFFTINDSSYGSSFYLLTGFHGLHVIIGAILLTISMIRMYQYHYSTNHHLLFEFSSWYWHFVDVVWLFLYIFIYWWNYIN
uniref:Cytochrome c oxidase subunit 3 n=1 Tax=Aulacus sinensis TaxID=2491146 RepID=A0A3S8V0A8_9HYME|nr:cytochrome c oxidase subunit 3 [Aulacus sinensis]